MKRFIATLAFLAPLAVGASPLPEYPFVHATGTAFVTIIPDQGSIDFEILVVAPDIEEAVATFTERGKAIRALTEQFGIAPDDIEIGDIRRAWTKDGTRQELRANAHINVRVLANWVPLVQGLLAVPNLEGFVTDFSSSEKDKAVDESVRDAIRDATRKARLIAEATGRKLGPVAGISTTPLKNLGNAMGLVPSDFYQRSSSSARPTRTAEEILTVTALKWSQSVDVVYKLK